MNLTSSLALLAAPFLLQSGGDPVADEVWTQAELEAVTMVIQKEVETIRKAEFKSPVAVKLIDAAGFFEYATKRMNEMSTPEQRSAEGDIMKMLGLFPADQDLMEATLALLEGQVGGFYDPAGNTFYLMESFTGGIAKVILAHELTHALDDQLFDLDGGFEKRTENRDALSAYHAVVEGSGTAAMSVWTMQHMNELDMDDLVKAASMGTDALAEAPPVLWKPLLASYTTGQSFLQKGYRFLKKANKEAREEGGERLTVADATDIAFAVPPLSTEQILHPEKYWDPAKCDDPLVVEPWFTPPVEWRVLDRSVSGELQLALITEESEPIDFSNQMELMKLRYTNEAAAGWGGDTTVLYGKGDARLLVLSTVWDTQKDCKQFMDAMTERLGAWRDKVAALDPGGLGSGVTLEENREAKQVLIKIWHGTN